MSHEGNFNLHKIVYNILEYFLSIIFCNRTQFWLWIALFDWLSIGIQAAIRSYIRQPPIFPAFIAIFPAFIANFLHFQAVFQYLPNIAQFFLHLLRYFPRIYGYFSRIFQVVFNAINFPGNSRDLANIAWFFLHLLRFFPAFIAIFPAFFRHFSMPSIFLGIPEAYPI